MVNLGPVPIDPERDRNMKKLNILVATLVLLLFVVPACRQPPQETDASWTVVAAGGMTPEQMIQRDKALAARDAMFASLKGRLMEVMGSEGPVAAISVCAKEAPQIAAQISEAHGLRIGRTSFRLRNAQNLPPSWAKQLVADRVAEPRFLTQQGRLAALLPIRMQAPCLMCHAAEDTIPPSVKDAIAEHYPTDQATGFQEGELRGWFHVEVPATDAS